jgi:hypothetical protein
VPPAVRERWERNKEREADGVCGAGGIGTMARTHGGNWPTCANVICANGTPTKPGVGARVADR